MSKILRLTFPQWQGADPVIMPHYVPELTQQEASQGYFIGSQLLEWLAPEGNSLKATVPISLDYSKEGTATEQGIFAYQTVVKQLQIALETINYHQPEKIVTLGGECSVSVAPFSYLAEKYQGDVAVVWIDAHPDLTLPNEDYAGYHAMALATLFGQGDVNITQKLPACVEAKNSVIVGFRSTLPADRERLTQFAVESITAAQANESDEALMAFLAKTGKKNMLVHLDLDGLEPTDLRFAVASDPEGLTLNATTRLINRIAQEYNLVGLTIAEPMPREVIKLRHLLHHLPLLSD